MCGEVGCDTAFRLGALKMRVAVETGRMLGSRRIRDTIAIFIGPPETEIKNKNNVKKDIGTYEW
jgi:hypothetical protein